MKKPQISTMGAYEGGKTADMQDVSILRMLSWVDLGITSKSTKNEIQ